MKIEQQSPFPETFIGIETNLARMAQCMYQHGDGHGIEDGETKDRVLSLLVEPIPLDNDKRFLVWVLNNIENQIWSSVMGNSCRCDVLI